MAVFTLVCALVNLLGAVILAAGLCTIDFLQSMRAKVRASCVLGSKRYGTEMELSDSGGGCFTSTGCAWRERYWAGSSVDERANNLLCPQGATVLFAFLALVVFGASLKPNMKSDCEGFVMRVVIFTPRF